MLFRIVFVGIAVRRLIAAVGQPPANGIPGFRELVGFHFETAHCILPAGQVHFSEFPLGSGILVYHNAGTLAQLIDLNYIGIVVIYGYCFGFRKPEQSPGTSPFKKFFKGSADLIERAYMSAVDQIHGRHFFYGDVFFHDCVVIKV